jgi:hypothetical protein
MTISYGPVPRGQPFSRAESPARVAANDNESEPAEGCLLHAALRHFAEHGLGAAELAQQRAEQAFFAGDGRQYRYWLEICRALDRRMAEQVTGRRQN